MAFRKPVSVSLPPPLDDKIARLAKKRNQTKSEFVRAALSRYIRDEEEWETRWKRLQAYGAQKMRAAGITSEDQLMDVLYEIRHGHPPASPTHARAARRR